MSSRFEGLDPADAFRRIHHSLKKISEGASFCTDRGFGWDIEDEKKQNRDFIAEIFEGVPELRAMMPDHARALVEGTLLADINSNEFVEARAYFRARRPRVPAPPVSPETRAELEALDDAGALQKIAPDLTRIAQLSGYCHDQGFDWSIAQEEEVGRALIAAAFATHPRLAELMPLRAGRLAEGLPIGDARDWAELDAAKAALNVDQPKPRRPRKKKGGG